jgi:hypothetical protein
MSDDFDRSGIHGEKEQKDGFHALKAISIKSVPAA